MSSTQVSWLLRRALPVAMGLIACLGIIFAAASELPPTLAPNVIAGTFMGLILTIGLTPPLPVSLFSAFVLGAGVGFMNGATSGLVMALAVALSTTMTHGAHRFLVRE